MGTAAIIISQTKEEAEHMLRAELNTRKLKGAHLPFSVEELNINTKQVVILNDGDY